MAGCYAYVVGSFGLYVVDVCNPASPVIVGSLETPGFSAVAVSGCYAYAVGSSGLCVVDVCDPTSPVVLACVSTPYDGRDVAVSGRYAYVAASSGFHVVDVSEASSPVIIGSMGGWCSGVAVSGDYAYVLVAYPSALQVVAIQDPTSPTTVGTVEVVSTTSSKVAVSGSHVYVAGWRFQVVDVSSHESPAIVGGLGVASSALAVAGSYVYLGGHEHATRQRIDVVDVSNPVSPAPVGSLGGVVYDLAVAGTHAYVVDRYSSLRVIDIGDPMSPVVDGSVTTTRHTMRAVTVSGSHAYVAGMTYGLCCPEAVPFEDELASGYRSPEVYRRYLPTLAVFDVSDPASPVQSGRVAPGDWGDGYRFEIGAIDVAVSGTYAYVAVGHPGEEPGGTSIVRSEESGGRWFSGLHVVDVSSPSSPTVVGSVATGGEAVRVTVAGHFAYVSSDYGLAVVDVSDPASPGRVGYVYMPGAQGVAVSGDYAYVAVMRKPEDYYPYYTGEGGIRVVDISDPTSPVIVFTEDESFDYSDVALSGSYAYITSLWGEFAVWDISDATHPVRVGGAPTDGGAPVAVSGGYAYVGGGKLRVFPVQCPPAASGRAVAALSGTPGRDRRPGPHLAIPAPNPASMKTELAFSLPAQQHAQLALYDVAGRRVRTLVDRMVPQGDHSVTWDARDHSGHRVAPGTYFVRFTAGDVTRTRKVVFLGGK